MAIRFAPSTAILFLAALVPSLATATTGVNVSYSYEPAQPRMVNGRPVLEHRYWACVKEVALTFDQPMRVATVVGNVYLAGSGNRRNGLTLKQLSPDFRSFTLGAGSGVACASWMPLTLIVIDQGVWSVMGGRTAAREALPLSYPAGRDSQPTDGEPAPTSAGFASDELDELLATRANSSAAAGTPLQVTPVRLNEAFAGMQSFARAEPESPLYKTPALKLMPLEFLLDALTPFNRKRQYGSTDLLYVLRRAARFVQLLFPELGVIPVGDLSEADGTTPRSGDTVLHPSGSHQHGTDADVHYVSTGKGNEPDAPLDYEKNFWFLFGVLQSTSVDLGITAYKDEFLAYAGAALSQGLINTHAVGRFHGLQQNEDMNHDKHVHVTATNLMNGGRSRKFTASDDVYACYLGLKAGSPDGSGNTCAEN